MISICKINNVMPEKLRLDDKPNSNSQKNLVKQTRKINIQKHTLHTNNLCAPYWGPGLR